MHSQSDRVFDEFVEFAPDVRDRFKRMFSFDRPLQPLDDLSVIRTEDG